MIQLEALQFGYEKALYEAKLNLQFELGKVYFLIGRNGIGKSTLLKTILLDLPCISGSVLINDKPLHELKIQERALYISFVHANEARTRYMKAIEFVSFGRLPHNEYRNPTTKELEKLYKVFNELEISHLQEKFIETCSDGEFQLLLIARAFAQQTPVILVDEATVHLDFINKLKVYKMFNSLSKLKKKCILIATHDLDMAAEHADKILLFDEKEIKMFDAKEDIIEAYKSKMLLEQSE